MGKPQDEKSEAINRHISSSTQCNSKQTGEKSNDHPEWLPDGWKVDFRTRKSGAKMGYGYKCYIDPSGHKFYSKPEVSRYIETVNSNTHTSKKKKICKRNDAVEKFNVEDLPPGQIVKVKDVVKSPVEDLPPGWITEAKVRKGGTGKKKDVLYIDPVSGYMFRSKKDALRYLNSGDISNCVLKPYKRHIQDEDKITPSFTGKKLKRSQSATRRQLFVGELVVKNQPLKNAAALTPEIKKTSDPDDVQDKNLVVNMLEPASKKNHSYHGLSKTKESNAACRFSRRLSGAEPDQLTNVAIQHVLQVPKRNLRNSRSVLDTDLTIKPFQQLNGALEVEQLHKMQAMAPLTSNKPSNKKEQRILCRSSKRLAGFEPELMSNSISYKRAPIYRSKKSKGEINATLQLSDGRPAMELADHASINGESSDKGRKLTETTPITSNQLKKFDEEMNNDDKSEPEKSLAFHYSWSDPCLEFAIQTFTGALQAEDSLGNGPVRISETDMSPKNKLIENVTGSSSDKNKRVHPKKPKNKNELTMPRRLSRRLAGHEPEVLPTEKAIEYATRKPCNDKPAATAILINGVSGHLHAREESKLLVQASDWLKCGESSSKNEKSCDAQTVPNEQVQRLEAENVGDDKSDPQFPSPIGDSWSDPCLDFAIKTLTGDLPVDAPSAADILPVLTFDINDPPADILPVLTFDINDPPIEELFDSMEQQSINEESRDNPNQSQTKTEFNSVCQPSKQLLNQPELTAYNSSCGNDLKFAARESYKDEDNRTENFIERESQRIEAGKARQMIDINKIILEEEPSEEKQLEGVSVAEKPQPETIINHDNSKRAFSISFMDSWSDSCPDFSFKTLSGTIPAEEQEPVNRLYQRGGGLKVPDFGFSSISHSGFSFHNDMEEKFRPGQQSSTSSSFLPQENPNLHGCSGVPPQQQYFQYSNNFQRR